MSIALWDKKNGELLAQSTSDLILTTCWCGTPSAVPAPLYRAAKKRSSQHIYCPLGHTFVYDDSLEKENERLKDRLASEQARKDQLSASLQAQRAATTRERNKRTKLEQRTANGVCPCCHRTFKQLAAHMKRQHPDFPESP